MVRQSGELPEISQLEATVPRFKLYAPGRWGEKSARDYNYSMVMEVDGRVELSGQGGWRPDTLDFPLDVPIETEINQAFDNVAFMLKEVGLDWANVAHVNSYHTPEPDGTILAATAAMAQQFRLRMPNHKPIWTCLGVAVLGDPKMRVEIRVTAFRG
jgi:enamine deaminase RidA (YjgF/YER057c/UK114 family)